MAGGTAAGTIIAWMIVGSQKVQGRIEQARSEQADVNRIRAIFGAESAGAEASPGPAWFFKPFGDADLRPKTAAALEDSQDVPRLRHFKTRQGIEVGNDSLG